MHCLRRPKACADSAFIKRKSAEADRSGERWYVHVIDMSRDCELFVDKSEYTIAEIIGSEWKFLHGLLSAIPLLYPNKLSLSGEIYPEPIIVFPRVDADDYMVAYYSIRCRYKRFDFAEADIW